MLPGAACNRGQIQDLSDTESTAMKAWLLFFMHAVLALQPKYLQEACSCCGAGWHTLRRLG